MESEIQDDKQRANGGIPEENEVVMPTVLIGHDRKGDLAVNVYGIPIEIAVMQMLKIADQLKSMVVYKVEPDKKIQPAQASALKNIAEAQRRFQVMKGRG